MSAKFLCPECKNILPEIIEAGTYWDYINSTTGKTIRSKDRSVEFYYCPECNADITTEVNEWFKSTASGILTFFWGVFDVCASSE